MASTGKRIEARRKALGLSRDELAHKLRPLLDSKTTRMTVWRVESGKRDLGIEELKLWAKALKAKPLELLA